MLMSEPQLSQHILGHERCHERVWMDEGLFLSGRVGHHRSLSMRLPDRISILKIPKF